MLGHKTRQCLWVLENRLAVRRASETLLSAQELIASLHDRDSRDSEHLRTSDFLVGRCALNRHLLLLDGALDRYTTERLFDRREAGNWAGLALATDESPPKQPRFRGLRFQITVLYLGEFLPETLWPSCTSPPIRCTSYLADIMHCPGKKGVDVSRVLEQQLSRLGLSCYDVVAGTGDGGGENEGASGIHRYFEDLCPGYVRHRCLPHISWRTGDMAIRSSGLEYKAICAYLGEGITWTRLKEIAVRDRVDGGLALFKDGSPQCHCLFKKSPGTIICNRPETDLEFLTFLSGKEHLLHRLALVDLEQRPKLGAEAVAAVACLGDIRQRFLRLILKEVLFRCFFLARWNSKHQKIAAGSSWEDLLRQATGLILNLEVTPEFLVRFGSTLEAFEARQPRPKTWVEYAVLQVVGDQDLVETYLREALDFHRAVTDSAA